MLNVDMLGVVAPLEWPARDKHSSIFNPLLSFLKIGFVKKALGLVFTTLHFPCNLRMGSVS